MNDLFLKKRKLNTFNTRSERSTGTELIQLDLNSNQSLFTGSITHNLAPLLETARLLIETFTRGNYVIFPLMKSDGSTIPQSVLIQTNPVPWFETTYFLGNYLSATGMEFDYNVGNVGSTFGGLQIRIDTLNVNRSNTNLQIGDYPSFLSITCTLFAWYFDVKLHACKCYPLSIGELNASASGIYKNCYDSECQALTLQQPHIQNPITHGRCDTSSSLNTIISVSVFSALNVNFTNLKVEQVNNCLNSKK
jgi:hypothetical protein